jgi:outer membrane protein OmpA-like peptidoglycan-associated protein
MKIIKLLALSLLLLSTLFANIDLGSIQKQAEMAAKEAAELTALTEIVRKITPIEFQVASYQLLLDDPSFKIAGYDVDSLMKEVIIPALSDIINKLPTNKRIAIIGHASKTGTEEASGKFMGNIALSQKRAEAVLAYIQANSNLNSDRFIVVAKGSSSPLANIDAKSDKNCRVSFDVQ